MSPTRKPRPALDRWAAVARRAARLLNLAVLGLYLTILAGEGGHDLLRLTAAESVQMALFLAACAGLVAAWRWEALGASLTLAALLLFYLNEYRLTGRAPRGWGLAVMLVPATLSLVPAIARRDGPVGGLGR